MKPDRIDLGHLQQALAATPGLLRAWLGQLPAEWLEWRERGGSWCPREILAHLIEGERTDWMPRARRLLAEGTSRPFDPFDRSAHDADADKPIEGLLDTFERLRMENVEALGELALATEDLGRKGVHPALGEVTLQNLLATWVVHDQDHIAQIARILARAHEELVGPWNNPDYLGILHRLLPRDRGDRPGSPPERKD